jgi:uncharacterized protein HemY
MPDDERRADVTVALDEGRAALARSVWKAAREHFERALDAEASAEAFDGLGQAEAHRPVAT